MRQHSNLTKDTAEKVVKDTRRRCGRWSSNEPPLRQPPHHDRGTVRAAHHRDVALAGLVRAELT
jgi:hypothetical protein